MTVGGLIFKTMEYLIELNKKILSLYNRGEEIPGWLFLDIELTLQRYENSKHKG